MMCVHRQYFLTCDIPCDIPCGIPIHCAPVNVPSKPRGRPWWYSVIPSTPDFPTEYQIRRNSNPARLPVFAAIWGPDFRASTIILTHMFKQMKQIRITLMAMFKVIASSLPVHQINTANMYATTRNTGVTRVIVALFTLCVAYIGSCLVLVECASPDVTSTLVNCN